MNISHSGNDKFTQSPRMWFLHYMLRLRPEVVGSPLFFGSAMDEGWNAMLRNKFQEEQEDVVGLFEAAMLNTEINGEVVDLRTTDKVKFSKADHENFMWTDEDRELAKTCNPAWVSLRRKGLLMLDAYQTQIMPHIKELLSVQKYIEIPNGRGDKIIGYGDLVARFYLDETVEGCDLSLKQYNDKIIVFDNKTSSSFSYYKDDCVEKSTQLATYFEDPNTDFVPDLAGYIVVLKNFRKLKKPMVATKIIIDKIDPNVIESIFESYASTLQNIKLGKFPCHENCSKVKFGCPYVRYCETNGEDTTGLVYVKESSK